MIGISRVTLANIELGRTRPSLRLWAALRAALAQVFLEWRGRKVTAKIYHGNTRSERTVRGCGFQEEERLEKLSRFTLTQSDYLELLTCPGEDGKLA